MFRAGRVQASPFATSSRGSQRVSIVRVYDPATSSSYGTAYPPYGQDQYIPPPPAVGARVEKWLQTPFDLLAFAPRAAAGTLLTLPERLTTLQTDVQKYMDLMQDPRPMAEKQDVLLREAEELLVSALERGVIVETDVLANLKTILPQQATDMLNEIVPPPPNAAPWTAPGVSASPYDTATTTVVTPPVTYYKEDVMASQLASELTGIKSAVTGLKIALENVRTNTEFSRTNLLRQALKEARDLLARRLAEVSPATSADASINAAAREARILLDEVDAQFFMT